MHILLLCRCCPVWLCLILTWAASPNCAVQISCFFFFPYGFLHNLLSFICSFMWGIWGDCLRALPPLGSRILGIPCLLSSSWSCHDWLGWEVEERRGEKAGSFLVLACFLILLSTTARAGNTFFGILIVMDSIPIATMEMCRRRVRVWGHLMCGAISHLAEC